MVSAAAPADNGTRMRTALVGQFCAAAAVENNKAAARVTAVRRFMEPAPAWLLRMNSINGCT
jgi:hypothetical protein